MNHALHGAAIAALIGGAAVLLPVFVGVMVWEAGVIAGSKFGIRVAGNAKELGRTWAQMAGMAVCPRKAFRRGKEESWF